MINMNSGGLITVRIPAAAILVLSSDRKVPILINRALDIRLISSISNSSEDMMGLPPSARVILADWVATTVFVILW